MIVECPRFILAEFNTHRMFSRNSASSRAVPFEKMLSRVKEDPFIPIKWMKDHPGMQGTKYFEDETSIARANQIWLEDRDCAIEKATRLSNLRDYSTLEFDGVTKQFCNRLLEPFMWHKILITATEWENFFHLRCPQYQHPEYFATANKPLVDSTLYRSKKDYQKVHSIIQANLTPEYYFYINKGQAEIHMMALAEAMWDAYNESVPKQLEAGEWHIPFGDTFDEARIQELSMLTYGYAFGKEEELKVKIATARSARVSYLNFEGKDDYSADIKLHNQLSVSEHFSPFEHCAKSMSEEEYVNFSISSPLEREVRNNGWCGNFRGFIQYRKMFSGENKD